MYTGSTENSEPDTGVLNSRVIGICESEKMFSCNKYGLSHSKDNEYECIPEQAVCNQKKDCSNGEDEKLCLKLTKSTLSVDDNDENIYEGYFLVRMKGIWHPYCSRTWSKVLGTKICTHFGFLGLDELETLDLHGFNQRRLLEQGGFIEESEGVMQIIGIENDLHMSRLHTNSTNIINILSENDTMSCNIGYIRCLVD